MTPEPELEPISVFIFCKNCDKKKYYYNCRKCSEKVCIFSNCRTNHSCNKNTKVALCNSYNIVQLFNSGERNFEKESLEKTKWKNIIENQLSFEFISFFQNYLFKHCSPYKILLTQQSLKANTKVLRFKFFQDPINASFFFYHFIEQIKMKEILDYQTKTMDISPSIIYYFKVNKETKEINKGLKDYYLRVPVLPVDLGVPLVPLVPLGFDSPEIQSNIERDYETMVSVFNKLN